MERHEFEELAQKAFDSLPERLQQEVENVHIVVEDLPSDETIAKMRLKSVAGLLGLYEGVPLSKRGTWYGTTPMLPDKITLYKANIERVARSSEEIRLKIQEVLIHEIAHHYGLDEEEIRKAGY